MEQDRYDLAVVALHPIQYQAGLWRTIARHPRLRLRVLYLDRVGVDGSIDPTMKAAMKMNSATNISIQLENNPSTARPMAST